MSTSSFAPPISPDGRWWWDGSIWKAMPERGAPTGTPQVSEDGRFFWDGHRWAAMPSASIAPPARPSRYDLAATSSAPVRVIDDGTERLRAIWPVMVLGLLVSAFGATIGLPPFVAGAIGIAGNISYILYMYGPLGSLSRKRR